MPRVIKRTPEWLVQPSPGHSIFSNSKLSSSGASHDGPSRTVAKGRGSEIFVASGNELRWADLGLLKHDFQEIEETRNCTVRKPFDYERDANTAYRLLKTPGAGLITALHVSPNHEYLAIVRTHQVYVAILPHSRHLEDNDTTPYKLKSYHLGPTIHCVEEPPIVSALWHPLGAHGSCLLTVTADAVVRLWEINRDDRSTFEQPSTSIDLKKLANAVSADQDFSASKFGSGKGFTPDSVELEPAAVCFGGVGAVGENPWAATTLWFASRGGDVYTLCPLLPRRFEAFADFIDSLSVLVAAKQLEAKEDRSLLPSADAQQEFLSSLQDQEPLLAQGASEFEARYVYARPTRPGPAPKLQGPFDIDPEPEINENDEFEISDVYVTPLELPEDQGLDGDPELPGSASLVCLLTRTHQVLMAIDFAGVDAQWVPARGTPFSTPKHKSTISSEDYRILTLFEATELHSQEARVPAGYPSITPDPLSPHAFFVTDTTGIHYISAARWTRSIQDELGDSDDGGNTGSTVRMEVFLDSAKSLIERPIMFTDIQRTTLPSSAILFADAASSSHSSSGLGYFLLSSRGGEPFAATLDVADSDLIALDAFESYTDFSVSNDAQQLLLTEPRDTYRPDTAFDRPSQLPQFINQQTQDSRVRGLLRADVDIENLNVLELMIATHKRVQREYNDLNTAASKLFVNSSRLQDNLREQINRVRELRDRVDSLTGDNADDESDEELSGDRLVERMEATRERQAKINERLEKLKANLGKVSTREMSEKEKAWGQEIMELDAKIVTGELDPDTSSDDPAATSSTLMDRVMKVTNLSAELTKLAKEQAEDAQQDGVERKRNGSVPSAYRKAKVAGVMELLERESVLVERAAEKFGRLKVV